MRDLESLITGRPPASTTTVVTAVVTRSDAAGVFATPLGGDVRHPIGPCKGASYLRPATAPGGAGDGEHAHRLERAQLYVGVYVALALTPGAPWILSADLATTVEP